MAWINAFDQGACSVEVYKDGELIASEDYAAQGISVDTTDGIVTMTAPSSGSGYTYDVRVVPGYSTAGMAVRLRAQATPDDPADFDAAIWSAGSSTASPADPHLFGSGAWTWAGYNAGRESF